MNKVLAYLGLTELIIGLLFIIIALSLDSLSSIDAKIIRKTTRGTYEEKFERIYGWMGYKESGEVTSYSDSYTQLVAYGFIWLTFGLLATLSIFAAILLIFLTIKKKIRSSKPPILAGVFSIIAFLEILVAVVLWLIMAHSYLQEESQDHKVGISPSLGVFSLACSLSGGIVILIAKSQEEKEFVD